MANKILLIEDNPHDVFALKRAFEKVGLHNEIIHFSRGNDVLNFLENEEDTLMNGGEASIQFVLTDLMLPDMSGLEILRTIKGNNLLKVIPVIIFSSSIDERDIDNCLRAGANSYIPKPITFNELLLAIRHLKNYWFEMVALPRSSSVVSTE